MRRTSTLLGIFSIAGILGGTLLVWIKSDNYELRVLAQTQENPRFRIVGGSFGGSHADYTLQTPPEEKNFADDCIGCKQEVGNAVVFVELGCRNISQDLFDANSENGVAEKEPIVDSQGRVVGERRMSASKDKDGKVRSARMFWIEGNDFWAVQTPTVELTKALRESEQFSEIRKIVAEEVKNYVPILNANTIGKDPCKGGSTQRRIVH